MALSNDDIKKLLEWFVKSSETNQEWGKKRKKAQEENHQWIQPSVIEGMADEDLEKYFINYYKSNTGYRATLNNVYRDRIIRDKNKFKITISYLFNEDINIEDRVNNVLNGEYQIEGFGPSILSSFLMDFKPDKYCQWNNKVESGLKVLEWTYRERGDSKGKTYQKVLNCAKKLINLRSDLNLSLIDIDLFLHTIAAEEEGAKALESVGKTSRNYWIFQANKEYYDLVGALKSCKELNWKTAQHESKIHKGDKVYLWQSGPDAGVYASSEVLTEPGPLSKDPCESPFFKIPEKFAGEEKRVRLSIKHVLQKPILKETLRKNPALSNLQIITSPRGTNFLITGHQGELLENLIASLTKQIGDYLPNEIDVIRAYRVIAILGQKIPIDLIFEQIEIDAQSTGLRLIDGWREKTEKIIIEQLGKKSS